MQNNSLLYAADENPPHLQSFMLALQQVLLVLAPVTVTPLVITRSIGLSWEETTWIIFASLVASGVSTVIQVARVGRVGSGYWLFMGTSGAFVACSLAAAQLGGMSLVATMCVLSAPVQILFGRYLGLFRKIITPQVGGVVVMLIVVSVLPIALRLMNGLPGSDVGKNLTLGLFTVGIVLLLMIFGNKYVRLWSPIIGIFSGCVLAFFMGLLSFETLGDASWVGLPVGNWPGFNWSFPVGFAGVYAAFIVVTLVGAIETLGDAMAVQRISERNFKKIDYERVQGAIYADGVGNALAGAMGTMPNTTYSNGIAILELTGVASRRPGIYSGLLILLLAFLPKMSALIMAVPTVILGAFLFILLSMLFVTGMKLVASTGFQFETGIIVGFAFWIGYVFQNQMFFPDQIPNSWKSFLDNGMVVGGTAAVVFSLLLNLKPRKRAKNDFVASVAELAELQSWTNVFADRLRLEQGKRQTLQLAMEEGFLYLAQAQQGKINVRLAELPGRGVEIELINRAQIDDIENAVHPADWTEASPEELQQLGLFLLSKVAHDVKHLKMSGTNYLSFRV